MVNLMRRAFGTAYLVGLRVPLAGLFVACLLSGESVAVTSYLDNGTIRIGADLDRGGGDQLFERVGIGEQRCQHPRP